MKGKLLRLLFPPRCVFCHGFLQKGESGVCQKCESTLQPGKKWLHPVGGEFLKSRLAVMPYEGLVRDAVHRYKFRRLRSYSTVFGELMARCVQENLNGQELIVTWAPVSRKRLRERGFDQSELLAKEIAARCGLPVSRMLEKVRHTPKQSGIRGAALRKANVLDAYRVRPASGCTGAKVLLVDDVFTTGATASECARMLKMAGAKEVHCIVFAAKR